MFKGINQKVLLLAVILGLATSIMVFFHLTRKAESLVDKKAVDVVVALVEISPRQVISKEMVEVKKMPAQFAHPLAFSSTEKLIGKVAKERIMTGEAVLKDRVLQGREGVNSSRLSVMIPQGKRAVTVAVNQVSGVAGMLQPGDFVDILGTFDENTAGENITALFLQNIEILAVAQETEEKKKTQENTTVTLLVTPWEAEQLALAEEKGVLRLALRPFQPESDVFVTNVVLSDLTRLSRKIPESTTNSAPLPPSYYSPPAQPYYETRPVGGKQIELIRGSEKALIEVQ